MADNDDTSQSDSAEEKLRALGGITPEEHSSEEKLRALGAVTHEEHKQRSTLRGFDPMGKTEATLAGIGQGAGIGFTPRVGAALGAADEYIQNKLGMGPSSDADQKLKDLGITDYTNPQGQKVPLQSSLSDLYNQYLDSQNKYQEHAKQSHPNLYKTGEFVGMAGSPMNKIGTVGGLGHAAEDASMLQKMGRGAIGGTALGGTAGLAQSSDLTDIPQDLSKVGQGMAGGAIIGAAAPPVLSGIGTAARTTGKIGKTIFGPVPQMFKKGYSHAAEGVPDLSSDEGQQLGHQDLNKFAQGVVATLQDLGVNLPKEQQSRIQTALIDDTATAKQLDETLNEVLQSDPKLNDPKAIAKLQMLKEQILTARDGVMTTRMKPKPVSNIPSPEYSQQARNSMPAPMGVGTVDQDTLNALTLPKTAEPTNELISYSSDELTQPISEHNNEPTEVLTNPNKNATPIEELSPSGLPAKQAEPQIGKAEPIEPELVSPSGGVAGHEIVHKATIEAGDQEAIQKFQQQLHEKLIDEQAAGKNHNASPMQIDAQPIPGTNKVRLIAKRAISNEETQGFGEQAKGLEQEAKAQAQQQKTDEKMSGRVQKENELAGDEASKQQAKELTDREKEAARLQKLLEKQNQDVEEPIRAGDRNVYDMNELYRLKKQMQSLGQYGIEKPSADEQSVNNMAGNLAGKLSTIIQNTADTGEIDAKIHAMNNIGEVLGIDTHQLDLSGGIGKEAQINGTQKLLSLIEPQLLNDRTLINQEKMQYVYQEFQKIDPQLAEDFLNSAQHAAETKGLIKEFSKPYEPSGINPIFNAIRRNASKAAYSTGYGLNQQVQRMSQEVKPVVDAGKKVFNNLMPENLQNVASRIAASGDTQAQQFGKVLSELANKDERTRNATLFVMQQQPQYQGMFKKWLPQDEKTPTARNKNLSGTTGQ